MPTLTRSVVPARRSRTKTSSTPLLSPATRLEALLWNATKRPSAETDDPRLSALPLVPPESTLTRSVVCAQLEEQDSTSAATSLDRHRAGFMGVLRRDPARDTRS